MDWLNCASDTLSDWLNDTSDSLMTLLNQAAAALSPNGWQESAGYGGGGGGTGFGTGCDWLIRFGQGRGWGDWMLTELPSNREPQPVGVYVGAGDYYNSTAWWFTSAPGNQSKSIYLRLPPDETFDVTKLQLIVKRIGSAATSFIDVFVTSGLAQEFDANALAEGVETTLTIDGPWTLDTIELILTMSDGGTAPAGGLQLLGLKIYGTGAEPDLGV
jgi:hypothetical protein